MGLPRGVSSGYARRKLLPNCLECTLKTTDATILVADLVGYTSLMENNRDAAVGAIHDLRQIWLEPAMHEHEGEALKRLGDGWIIAFNSPVQAIDAAIRVQERLAAESGLRLRIGIHHGEVLKDELDFYGSAINLATRIQVEAPPGGVMISEELLKMLPDTLTVKFSDAGSFRLKNIALPMKLMQWRPDRNDRGSEDVPTIAVELFAAAPDDQETQAAAEDLRDQLIQRLARRTGVRVLDDSVGGAGRAVYRLRGRVRLSSSRGRVSLSMLLRETPEPVWSKSYDGDPSDIFAFCDDIIDRADTDLRVQINSFDGDRVAHLPVDQLSVSELRSRAATVLHRYTVEAWEETRDLLKRAMALSPEDAMASAMYAESVLTLALASYETLSDVLVAELSNSLDRAVEASPRSDYIIWARAFFNLHVKSDVAMVRADLRRTLTLNPVYTHGIDLMGLVELKEGNVAASTAHLKRSIDLTDADPILPYRHFLLAVAHLCADDASSALKAVNEAIMLRPSVWAYHRLQAECLLHLGDDTGARTAENHAAALGRTGSVLALRPTVPMDKAALLEILDPKKSLRISPKCS